MPGFGPPRLPDRRACSSERGVIAVYQQCSGGRIRQLLTPRVKLHEIQCHFRELPHAVAKYGLRARPRTRPSSSIKF